MDCMGCSRVASGRTAACSYSDRAIVRHLERVQKSDEQRTDHSYWVPLVAALVDTVVQHWQDKWVQLERTLMIND